MSRERAKRLYRAHSAFGVVLGLMLYVVMFTGTIAVLTPEFRAWESTASRRAVAQDYSLDAVFRELAPHHELAERSIFVRLPRPGQPQIRVSLAGGVTAEFPDGRSLARTSRAGFSDFHRHLHTSLHLGQPGRLLIGLVGVGALFMLTTGIWFDRRRVAERYWLRASRSRRTFFADIHKRIGLWGLPFHGFIALSGALLGLLPLLLVLAALAAFGGDQDAALAAVVGERVGPAARRSPMVELDPLVRDAAARLSRPPTQAQVQYYGDENARLRVSVGTLGSLSDRSFVEYSLRDGTIVQERDDDAAVPGVRVTQGIFALHYANWSGTGLRLLYALLGASGSLMIAAGLRLRRSRGRSRRGPNDSEGRRPLEIAETTIVAGMPFATSVTFIMATLYAARSGGEAAPFLAVYLLALGLALVLGVVHGGRRARRRLWGLAGIAWAIAPFVDIAINLARAPDVIVTVELLTVYGLQWIVAAIVLIAWRRTRGRASAH